jgi:hypothetical protein
MTVAAAHMEMDRRLIEMGLDHQSLEQIDALLCEDFRTIAFEAHLRDGRSIMVCADLPAPIDPASFDHWAWRDDFLGCFGTARH